MSEKNSDLWTCLLQYESVFEHFLVPLSLLEYMPPSFGVKSKNRLKIQQLYDSPSEQVKIFLEELQTSDDIEGMFQSFKDALHQCEDQRWIYLLMTGGLNDKEMEKCICHIENAEVIKQLFEILLPQLHVVDAHVMVTVLTPWLSDGERDILKSKYENLGNTCALWWVITFVQRKKPTWLKEFYEHTIEANYANPVEGTLAKALATYFNFEHESICHEVPVATASGEGNKDATLQDFIQVVSKDTERDYKDMPVSSIITPIGDLDLEDADESNLMTKIKNSRYEKYELRNYQQELIRLAKMGKNVIVCAPPGSGKTLIAAHIILNYLETRDGNRNVLFFTPGISLAQQQCDRLEEYLPPKYKVDFRCGNGDKASLMNAKWLDVIVLTPQILINELTSKDTSKAVKQIDEFGLILFDECHHCMKGHPYNAVMRRYFELKNKPGKSSVPLPQIVGFTATLGIGKAVQIMDALEEMKQLCSNLNAVDGIVTVQEPANLQELQTFIPKPDESRLTFTRQDKDPFYEKINLLMSETTKILKELEATAQPPRYEENEIDKDKYKHWCVDFKKYLSKSESKHARDACTCVEYLEICGEALDRHCKCPASNAVKLFEEWLSFKEPATAIEKLLFRRFKDAMVVLKQLSKDPRCKNPNLDKIKDCILRKFVEKEDSRVMLMVQTRTYTHALKDWMEDMEELNQFNPEIFTGTAGSSSNAAAGITLKQQEQTMKSFKSGKHKILICTPAAAGEGIDVVGCNLVINYNYLRNEIATVQIKGRVRKRGGEMIQISSDRVDRRDRLNQQKTLLMDQATKELQQYINNNNHSEFISKLESLQKKARMLFGMEVLKKMNNVTSKSLDEFLLQCRKCKTDICSSFNMRVIDGSQHTNITAEFKEKYVTKEHPRKDHMGPYWTKKSKVFCKNCMNDWGIEAQWKDLVTLPLIKIEGFRVLKVLNNTHGHPYLPRKWKESPFTPQEAHLDEIISELDGFVDED